MNNDNNGWFKSTYSPANGDCVEIKVHDSVNIGIRDSKNSGGARLKVHVSSWGSFAQAAAAGHFEGIANHRDHSAVWQA